MKQIDLIITNANILTFDKHDCFTGSLAVTNGEIVNIWKEAEPTVSISSNTEVINLKGKTLIPGFIDTHNHILMYSLNKNKVDCSTPPNKNIDDIMNRIKSKVEKSPHGEWIEGYGYDDTLLDEKRHPTRSDLDKASPHHPVYISHISGHLAVVNSKALELAQIDENISDPQGGHFGRDGNGKLNGVLFEIAVMERIQQTMPKPSLEEMLSLLEKGVKDYLAEGITTNTDAAVGLLYGDYEFDIHMQAAIRQVNPMHTQLMIMHDSLRKNKRFGNYNAQDLNEEMKELSGGKARLDSAKMFQDGSIQGLTGALREPYFTFPDEKGDLFHLQKDFNEEILDLHKRGFRIAIHGNGDRAIGSILEGFSHALALEPRQDHRHRIEHVQTATIQDLDFMQQLGVAGSVFINHVYYWGDRHRNLFLGQERASRINPLSDIAERNLLFTLHSDCPITPISPLFSMWAAVNRLTRKGEILGEDQRIDALTALKAMTIYGAQLNFNEASSGSIEIGKQADFAVLEEDPTKVNPLEIKDIPVHATIIDGKVVYVKQGFNI